MTKKRFRIALVLSLAIGVLGMIVSFAGESGLPAPLQAHLELERERDLVASDWVILALALPILAGGLASFFGMLKFLPHSRSLSIAVSLVSLATFPLFGPTVEPGITTALFHLSSMSYGALIAISYLPPAAQWFQDQPPTAASRPDVV